ncbi:11-beta-hydroxysteroid dehydrogenase type 2 isoform X1 [Lampris incognitus]|uniref:11-beta-hydroxysteroid dehydrogenase type 2 isoform X1 n=1 Tax=Lampris incognitus TaxID=2546036 RepID=UPI0024B54603|nr:11-beta-hydroxysteroid dehydrogenase type 2 isoform X1 [Lampris incognitus]
MMEDYTLPFWIYMGVLTMLVGGAMKKLLASHISAAPTLVAWLGATVLVERLWTFYVPFFLGLAVIFLTCRLYSTRNNPEPLLPAEGKAVLITGCDSGFGKATARSLDALGFEVFATVLDLSGAGARELRSSCSPRLTLLQVDITQPQQIQQALLDTRAKLGLRGLWGLVNNAGVCVNFGDAELSLMSNYRGCMEVNFFGTLAVTKAFLPLLRQAKGRITTISSPAGDQPFPCLAAYGASKAALNLLINTLRHELEPWGVRVSIILPSSYKTGQASNPAYWEQQYKHTLQNLPPGLLEEYGEEYMNETKELFQNHSKTANEDLSPVIDAIVQALLSPQPLVRYYAGPRVSLMYFIFSYLPSSISDKFLQKLFVKKKLMPRALRKQSALGINLHHHNNNNEEKLDK